MDVDSLSRVREDIRKREFSPVYLLFGEEEYQLDKAVALFRKEILPEEVRAFNITEMSAKDADLQEVIQVARTLPMIASHRIVFLSDLNVLREADWEIMSAYVQSPNKRCILILLAAAIDRRTTFYKLLKEKGTILEFARLKGAALERWAADRFRHHGVRISAPSVKKLVDLSGSDLQSLSNEVDKLMLYAGKDKIIPDDAVALLVEASRQHGIFELTGALGRQDRQRALKLLANLFDSGESAVYIATMIAWQFRRLLVAKELMARGKSVVEIAATLQIRFALEEFISQVRTTPFDTARRIYIRLAAVDDQMKSSRLDDKMLLESLICSL